MRQAYKFKLYTADRNIRLDRQRIVACQVWNHCIALHRRYYRMYGKHLQEKHLKRHIAFLRKHVYLEWQCLGSQAVQDVIERIEKAYKRFFDWVKKRTGRRVAPPKFRKRIRYKSFTLKQAGWKLLSGNHIQIGRCSYKFYGDRQVTGDIKTVTIGRDAVGDWFIVFSVLSEDKPISRTVTGKTAGLDFGLSVFITLSNGEMIHAPQPLLGLLKTLKTASKNVSRKKKGSSSRRKAVKILARLHRRIANIRTDWMHKTARYLAQAYDVICIEDISLEGMKKLWGRKVSDIAWNQFVSILEWHCLKAGSKLVRVDRFFPSSKMCSVCGHIHEGLSLKDRTWVCPKCGAVHDRDINASVNIEREGLRIFSEQYEAGHRLGKEAA